MLSSRKEVSAMKDDVISRQAAIDMIIEDKIGDQSLKIMTALGCGDKAETLNMTCDRHAKMLMSLPPAKSDRSLWFRIGEICVDESKGIISADSAVEKIRELLREAGRRTDG